MMTKAKGEYDTVDTLDLEMDRQRQARDTHEVSTWKDSTSQKIEVALEATPIVTDQGGDAVNNITHK